MEEQQIELVDAAAQLRLPYHTVHRWALTGRLEAERRHGRWFVTRRSLEEQLARKREHEAPQPGA